MLKCYVLFNDSRNCRRYISVTGVPEFCPAGVLLHATKSTDMSLTHLSTPGPGSNPQPQFYNVVIFHNDEVRSEDSPKDYPAFAFWLGRPRKNPTRTEKCIPLDVTLAREGFRLEQEFRIQNLYTGPSLHLCKASKSIRLCNAWFVCETTVQVEGWGEHCTTSEYLRHYKIYARRIIDYIRTLAENPELNLENRVFIMKMHSVIHNQLSAPVYRPMLQYSWQLVGYVNPEQVSDFKNLIEVAFDFQHWSVVQKIVQRLYQPRRVPDFYPTGVLLRNACYYSVEKLLSSSLLSKNLKVRIYKTVILPVILYGCETWTLTLREEHRLSVFENKVLRKIFRAKRNEVTVGWRKLHNTELHALYSSRRSRWVGHAARMGESRNAYRVLVERPEGKIPLGRPKRRWEDNIKMDLREVGYDDRDLINLAQTGIYGGLM
ncbi:hypothetical protein ANN_09262 [Periplaneta americana]|uniref:Uncharacterized protein n=1 Tax=Periplaneta americana TaxID=6978 RepID=A0ABQ8TN26_PERAM|nr:hypothetical protein ANN_09262 [Periplaneta americana]